MTVSVFFLVFFLVILHCVYTVACILHRKNQGVNYNESNKVFFIIALQGITVREAWKCLRVVFQSDSLVCQSDCLLV